MLWATKDMCLTSRGTIIAWLFLYSLLRRRFISVLLVRIMNMMQLRTFKTFRVMAQIKSEAAYRAAMRRIEELLTLVNDETPEDDPNYLELDMISDMVEEYEDVHYPISKPTLIDVIKLRLYEMGITQTKLAEMLGLSNARVSEILNGKSEPSLKIGRELSRQLNIDPSVVLGL